MSEIVKNEVVQLNPELTENEMFAGCFLVITDVYSWGVQGYVQSLGSNGEPGGQAYYRAKTGTFQRLRVTAEWVIE